jgi:hypothetical protein
MSNQNRVHCQAQVMQAPVQLTLDMLGEEDSYRVQVPERERPQAPITESHERVLLRDAQAHWRAVDRLTRNLRKRARVSKTPPASSWVNRANLQISAQKTLWVSVESNDAAGPDSDCGEVHQNPVGNTAARNNTVLSSDPGLEICRHLVAALRLQHEQDLLRQANLDEMQSA